MCMKKLNLERCEKDELVALLEAITEKLDKKKSQLQMTQKKLRAIRNRFSKTQAIVKYQRERIIVLYGAKIAVNQLQERPASKT